MYRSTNQGIYMRDSVSRIIAKDNWVKRKIIDHEDDLVTAILKDVRFEQIENVIWKYKGIKSLLLFTF